jgi:hypothetical protein
LKEQATSTLFEISGRNIIFTATIIPRRRLPLDALMIWESVAQDLKRADDADPALDFFAAIDPGASNDGIALVIDRRCFPFVRSDFHRCPHLRDIAIHPVGVETLACRVVCSRRHEGPCDFEPLWLDSVHE